MSNIIKHYPRLFIALSFGLFFFVEILAMKEVLTLPQAIEIGPLSIRLYGLLILSAILLVLWLVEKEARQTKSLQKVNFTDLALYVVLFGVIGARLYHLATDWPLYASNPITALYIWNGGLGIFGAVLGGMLGVYVYIRHIHLAKTSGVTKATTLAIIDLIALFMPLAQIIGRTGNLINHELYGWPTTVPWAWKISSLNESFEPTFLYEQVGLLVIFVTLLYFRGKRKISLDPGKLTLIYLAGYSIVRFAVEFARTSDRVIFGVLSVNQVVCVGAVAICLLFLIVVRRLKR
jgi:phosphatidylglycerol:prolipoprotein diacylglycerol transferase